MKKLTIIAAIVLAGSTTHAYQGMIPPSNSDLGTQIELSKISRDLSSIRTQQAVQSLQVPKIYVTPSVYDIRGNLNNGYLPNNYGTGSRIYNPHYGYYPGFY